MGAGFIMGGFCPGTGISALSIGKIDALVFLLGGLTGAFIFAETGDLRVAEKAGSQFPGLADVFKRQPEGVYSRVIYPVGGEDVIGKCGFQFKGFPGVNLFNRNTALRAQIREVRNIVFIVTPDGHKETARVFDALGGQLFQEPSLLLALRRDAHVS